MILSNTDIRAEIEGGGLKFEPQIEVNQFSTSSVDLRLGNEFTIPKMPPEGMSIIIDPNVVSSEDALSEYSEKFTVPPGGKFELKPRDFVLGYTLEVVELPNYLAARIEGRSAMARLGVSIHQTAPTVQANFRGQLRLEISNLGPSGTRNPILPANNRAPIIARSAHCPEPVAGPGQFYLGGAKTRSRGLC